MERVDTNPLDGTTISAMDSPEIHPEINPTDDFDAPSINTNTAVSTGEPSPLDYHEETSFTALDQVDSIEDTLEHGTYQPYWNKYLPEKVNDSPFYSFIFYFTGTCLFFWLAVYLKLEKFVPINTRRKAVVKLTKLFETSRRPLSPQAYHQIQQHKWIPQSSQLPL